MQSLQADQSLYNRKGVCYISLSIGRWLDIRTSSYICEGKDKQFSFIYDVCRLISLFSLTSLRS